MKKRLLMLALHLAASGTDAYFTNRNQHLRFHSEMSPIARPFVSNGQPLLITYFAATFGIETVGEYELRKHHHERLSFGLAAFNIAEHATGAAISAHGYNPGGNNAAH